VQRSDCGDKKTYGRAVFGGVWTWRQSLGNQTRSGEVYWWRDQYSKGTSHWQMGVCNGQERGTTERARVVE